MKARGFVERSGMVLAAGLPRSEMPRLNEAVRMSRAEENLLVGWSAPPSWDAKAGVEADPPGRGQFLIKVGGRPGIPVRVTLTDAERAVNDTNKRWHAPTDPSHGISAPLLAVDPTPPAPTTPSSTEAG